MSSFREKRTATLAARGPCVLFKLHRDNYNTVITDLNKKRDLLKVPIFAFVQDRETLDFFHRNCRVEYFGAGEKIVTLMQPLRRVCFFVLQGKCNNEGEVLSAGDCFGYEEFMAGMGYAKVYFYTVTALESVEVLVMNEVAFNDERFACVRLPLFRDVPMSSIIEALKVPLKRPRSVINWTDSAAETCNPGCSFL